jgi:hypothetical protein
MADHGGLAATWSLCDPIERGGKHVTDQARHESASPNSIRFELAAALRAVNVAYNAMLENRRPTVAWGRLDDVLEEALAQPNRSRALEAIGEWKRHHLSLLEQASR